MKGLIVLLFSCLILYSHSFSFKKLCFNPIQNKFSSTSVTLINRHSKLTKLKLSMNNMRDDLRNVAIIAHVDHGKVNT